MDADTWQWLAAFLLLAGAAILAAADAALGALGDARARQLVENGGPRARLLAAWVNHPERVHVTLTIGAALTAAGMGALASSWTGAGDSGIGWIGATLVATAVLLVVGHLVPRVLGRRYPARTAVLCMPAVHALQLVLWPFAVAVEHVSRSIASRLGPGEEEPAVTTDDIEYLIEVGTREGAFDEVREQLLNSVLEFADRVVREIMVPRTRMVAIDRDAPPGEILRIVTENPYSRMPVYQGSVDNVIGVLLVRDLIPELAALAQRAVVALDKHLKTPLFVPEQMKISRLLKEMQRRKIHLAVVVDEFGGTAGIVTLEDVIEEIVGEIQDEADAEAAPVRPAGEGAWLADASIPLRDLEAYLNGLAGADPRHEVRFPEDGDYETLGGFVTARAGGVPAVGSRLDWDGLSFTVRAGDERRVARVEIARRPPGADEAPAARTAEQGS